MSIISKARLYMRSLRPASSRPTTPSPVRQAVSSSRPAAPDPTTPLPELRPLSMPATNTLLSELGSIARELDALARDKTIHVSREWFDESHPQENDKYTIKYSQGEITVQREFPTEELDNMLSVSLNPGTGNGYGYQKHLGGLALIPEFPIPAEPKNFPGLPFHPNAPNIAAQIPRIINVILQHCERENFIPSGKTHSQGGELTISIQQAEVSNALYEKIFDNLLKLSQIFSEPA